MCNGYKRHVGGFTLKISKIVNAMILDMEDNEPFLGTLILNGGVISDIVPQEDIVEDDSALDLEQQWITPGFIDTHSHPTGYGSTKLMVNCAASDILNITDLINKFNDNKDSLTNNGWLIGYGYNEKALAEQRHPNRFDLDQISQDTAIAIMHYSGHMATVNTKALQIMGIELTDDNPEGGYYERDSEGYVNGVLIELPAIVKLRAALPKATADSFAYSMNLAIDDYVKNGITNTSDLLIGGNGYTDYKGILTFLNAPQRIRTRWVITHELLEKHPEFKDVHAETLDRTFQQHSNRMSHLGGVKFFNDGSIQLQTASIRGTYLDGATPPAPLMSQSVMTEKFKHFQQLGFNIITHANGDYAAQSVIEAYKDTAMYKTNALRNRVEHLQTATRSDIQEMAEHHIGGSFFINHVYYFGDLHRDVFLGSDKANNLDPVKWAEDENMLFTLHTDAPVTPISPLESIQIAVDRKTKNGAILGAHQRLSRSSAYKKMTADAARLNHTEDYEGTIKVGHVADFVILNRNPLEEDVTLDNNLIEATICDGKLVYKK